MKKRIIAALLSLAMVAALVSACGDKDIADSQESIAGHQMDDCPGPEDEAAAKEGQGVNDGDDDTQ